MTGHLANFLHASRDRVAAGAYATRGPRLPSNGSLLTALRTRSQAILAEVKPRSPSAGVLLHGRMDDLLADYVAGGAAALSILTDATHFGGSPDLLVQAHATGLPLLMKDFVVDRAQVQAAAHFGASAILLIERAFAQPADREVLVQHAHEVGLEVLLEVHDAADWQRAQASRADLLGVNARDLDSLHVDADAARHLLSLIAASGRPVVALSGIASRAAAQAARDAGAIAILVGTHLLASPDPRLALRALQRPLAKVCGLRTSHDVQVAAAAGADLVGFVVGSPTSPRNVAPLEAQRFAEEARGLGLRTVLVSRNPDAALVLEWCRLVRPHFVQVHGLPVTAQLRYRLAAIPVRLLAAITPNDPPAQDADGFVMDSNAAGGSGVPHGWQLVPNAAFSLIAGGLDATNVATALARSRAWGADASSRLESSPGTKDARHVQAFVAAVHAA